MAKTAIVLLAEGFEEIEALAPVDVLRRAGIRVTIAGVDASTVKSSRGVSVGTDMLLDQVIELSDAVIVPGGMPGSTNLARSEKVSEFLKKMNESRKLIAAICAAPAVVLAPLGILDGKKATCYPGCEADFTPGTRYSAESVVTDGNVITSQGPGTALAFSLAIVEALAGTAMVKTLREKMLIGV